MLLMPTSVKYRGTITGLRISGVNGGATESGGAFIDGANASITALADGNHLIEIYSTTGMIKGVLKAAGSAEGLDATNLITNWTNAAPPPYDIFTDVGANITSAIYLGNSDARGVSDNFTVTQYALYNIVSTLTLNSGAAPSQFHYGGDGSYLSSKTTALSAGANTIYYTEPAGGASGQVMMRNENAGNWSSTFVLKKVLAPSSSGSTIVSQKGGSLFSWAYKNASFAYNEASYTVVVKLLR